MSISRKVPEVYPHLKKGDRLYAVITYHTPNLFLGHYLPRPYFILEVFLEQVSDGSGGVQYFFDTNFNLDTTSVFIKLDDAKSALVGMFEAETGGVLTRDKVRLVSSQEYKDVSRKIELERKNRVA